MADKKSSKQKPKLRPVDLLVISDVHLGTYGCKSNELLKYLKSIDPKKVVLNGDILDIWQFSKNYWPKSHMKVVRQLLSWVQKDIPIYYLTGNHDEMLRKFAGFEMGSLKIKNKLVLELDGKQAWFFHGDVFDVTMQHSKWLTKLGSIGYDMLIHINSFINFISQKLGKGRISLSKKIKDKVKGAVKFINNFEKVATDIAIDNGYEYVVLGHIHHPEMKEYSNAKGRVMYLNSGDWVENMTSLEFHNNVWKIYTFKDNDYDQYNDTPDLTDKSPKELFDDMVKDFNSLKKLSNS